MPGNRPERLVRPNCHAPRPHQVGRTEQVGGVGPPSPDGVPPLRVHGAGHGHGSGGKQELAEGSVNPARVHVAAQGAVQGLAFETKVELVPDLLGCPNSFS